MRGMMRWALALVGGVVCGAVTGPARAESPHHYLGAAPLPRETKVWLGKPVIPPLPTVPSPLAMVPPANANVSTTAGLVANIESLDRAFAAAPHGSQDRADLALRLQRENTALELVLAAQSKGAITEAARLKLELLIATVQRRIEECGANISLENPHYASIDESLWLRGRAFDRAGFPSRARMRYYEILVAHQGSAFVADAYLAFGDSFFAEALSDPSKWVLAEKAYEEALRAAQNDARRAYASYRLAHSIWRTGRVERAASELASAAALANKAGAPELASAAYADWALAWSQNGSPRTAFGAVTAIAGLPGPTNPSPVQLLDRIAATWSAGGRGRDAAALDGELIARWPDDDRVCAWRASATEATLDARAGFKNEMNTALEAQLATWARYAKATHPDEAQRDCTARTAALLVDTALRWHTEAVGSREHPGTGERATMALAQRWYLRALAEWDAFAWASIHWPRDGAWWPTRSDVLLAVGDLAYSDGRWADCATASLELRTVDPDGPLFGDAVHGELACGVRTLVVAPAVRTPSR